MSLERQRYMVAVTTCERAARLRRLLRQLQQAAYARPTLQVAVFDDATTDPLIATPVGQDMFRHPNWSYYRWLKRRGKPRFWRTWSEVFEAFEASDAEVLVTLPDDCELSEELFDLVDQASARGLEVMNLHVDRRFQTGCWRSGPAKKTGEYLAAKAGPVELLDVGWVDGFNAMSRRSVVEALDARVEPVERDWGRYPELGSGVGAQITERLRGAGVAIYGTDHALVRHGTAPSVMNPEARARTPLKTVRFLDDGYRASSPCQGCSKPARWCQCGR